MSFYCYIATTLFAVLKSIFFDVNFTKFTGVWLRVQVADGG